ncbi:MAG: phosphotransferase [Cyanobacteria bacterium HKST-UBA02]|nr:phosphotransferase [Cyanobacteria bacterium HKST-UBA02]
MRANWRRGRELPDLTVAQIEKLMAPAFQGARVERFRFAEGGLSNTNLVVHLAGRREPLLLRIFESRPESAAKEYAIARRLEDRVPVAAFHALLPDNEFTGSPYAILEYLPGERLELLFPSLDGQDREAVGFSLGAVLAAINQETFESPGFLSAELEVVQTIELGSAGMVEFVESVLSVEPARSRIDTGLLPALKNFLRDHAALLDQALPSACLTHSDFGGSNILADRRSGRPCVSGVLDWEFAFSGSPYFDLGNLLRAPLGDDNAFAEAVAAGYRSEGGVLDRHWRKIAMMVDLTAWLDFLSREEACPELIEDAGRMIGKTMTAFDPR